MSQEETRRKIDGFLESGPFAVVGASTNRAKYGNKVLRCYLQHGRRAVPVNPRGGSVTPEMVETLLEAYGGGRR